MLALERESRHLHEPWVFHLVDEAGDGRVSDEGIRNDQECHHDFDPCCTLRCPWREERLTATDLVTMCVQVPLCLYVICRLILPDEAEDDCDDRDKREAGRRSREQ